MLLISISYSPHQPLQNRTIPLAFRRVRVCVCFLVSHPCETMGTHAKASLPLYERSVGFASLQSLWAFISGVLALLAPPVASNLSIPTTIVKGQQSHCLVLSPLPLNERSVVLHPHQPSQKHIHPFAPHPSISHYSPSNIHFLPAYP